MHIVPIDTGAMLRMSLTERNLPEINQKLIVKKKVLNNLGAYKNFRGSVHVCGRNIQFAKEILHGAFDMPL